MYNALLVGDEVLEEIFDLENRSSIRYEVDDRLVDLETNEDGYWVRLH